MADLDALRARIDELDKALIAVVAERLEVCREVAAVKEHSDTPVIQPARVRDVITSRRQRSIEAGIDPDFAEQLFRVLLTETHRIEVAGQRPDSAPEKEAASTSPSGLDTVISRVDHVVVAVPDLDAARERLTRYFGFHEVPLADGALGGVTVVAAGGFTVVLISADASPAVALQVAAHGYGIQHIAVEVLNAAYARACLVQAGAEDLGEVVVDDEGHEQFYAGADAATMVPLAFISRVGHRVGLGGANVMAMVDAAARRR
ncbi:MAG: chorismate mutase [Ilumatobacteraceae bacterium]